VEKKPSRYSIQLREVDAVVCHNQRYAVVPLLREDPVWVPRLLALSNYSLQRSK
jgi:hypothetical protein